MRPEACRAGAAGVAGVAEATKGLQDVVACFQYFSTLRFFKISKTSEVGHSSPDSHSPNSNARGGGACSEGATVSARETVGGGDRGGVSRSVGGEDAGGDRGEHGSCNRDATAATAMQHMQQLQQGDEGTDGVGHAAQCSTRKDAQGNESSRKDAQGIERSVAPTSHIIMLCPITQVTCMLTYCDAC